MLDRTITRLFACGLLCCVPTASDAAIVEAIGEITVRDDNGDGSFFTVDFENNYLPNVVLRENGAASFEALKAQAVAARSFAYHQLIGNSFIRNSVSDQVYSLGGEQNNPGGRWDAAVKATRGEILSFNQVLTAAFYVAGAIPSSDSGIATPSDPDPTGTERWVTYTFDNAMLGSQNTGTPLGFVGTPSNPNYPNRGAMSQNGADRLSDGGAFYQDILKFYYGGDIQLSMAAIQPGQPPIEKTLTGFESGNEHFVRSITFAGQTRNLASTSSTQVTSDQAQQGTASQRLTFDYDAVADLADGQVDGFTARHLSSVANARRLSDLTSGTAIQPAADPVGNLMLPTQGTIGLWLLVEPNFTDAQLQVSLAIDEWSTDVLNADLEQSMFLNVIADGNWHSYEWSLENDSMWIPGFSSNNLGDGILGESFSVDSIVFQGQADAVVYLDNVFYSSVTAIPEPSSVMAISFVCGGLLCWQRQRRKEKSLDSGP